MEMSIEQPVQATSDKLQATNLNYKQKKAANLFVNRLRATRYKRQDTNF